MVEVFDMNTHVVVVRVNKDLIPSFFIENRKYKVVVGIPADSVLLTWRYNDDTNQFEFMFESNSLPEVPEDRSYTPQVLHVLYQDISDIE